MPYILCGYAFPRSKAQSKDTSPKCLLYHEEKGVFGVKSLRTKGCLREAFGKDKKPPFLFERVVDNAFTGGIQLADKTVGPVFTVDTTPHTILKESDIDDIFESHPGTIRQSVMDAAAIPTKMTEREYVLTTGFKQSLLSGVRVALTEKLGLRCTPTGDYIPTRMDTLFVSFEPVDYYASSSKYPHGPDSVILRHKIIKHVLEDACPYTKVALFDSLGMEKALALCLPTGSTMKGVDIFWKQPQKPEYCLKVDEELFFDGGDFRILTPEEVTGKKGVYVVPEIDDDDDKEFFKWVPIDSEHNTEEEEEDKRFYDFGWQLSLLKHVFLPGETAVYFKRAAVVYSTHDSEEPFACIDFSNFYANIVIKFGLDNYIPEVLKRMTAFRSRFPEMKRWIVSILGKSRWFDPFLYNRMKTLSVAVVISTIKANAHMVTGSATDGLMVKPAVIDEFVYPVGFPVKREFVPKAGTAMISSGPSAYAGVCGLTGEVVHRGMIGRGAKCPVWYHELVTEIVDGCLNGNRDKSMANILAILKEKATRTNQYLLPDTHRAPVATQDMRRGTEFYVNEMCIGIAQMYAIVDESVIAISTLGGHDPPTTMAVWGIKHINVNKYVEEIKDRISRVASTFSGNPEKVCFCEKASEEIVKHIKETLPKDRAMYPGGVDYA